MLLDFDRRRTSRRDTADSEQGQSLVEMAFGFVILIMIMMGLLDMGRLFFTYVALEDAVGEAALYLSLNPECRQAIDCADPNNAEWRAFNAGGSYVEFTPSNTNLSVIECVEPTDWANGEPNASDCLNAEKGYIIEVTMVYNFPLFTPLMPEIAGTTILPLRAHATQVVIEEQSP